MTETADRRFPTLNAVRAVGALMVVCTHSAFNTGEINRGWHGAVLSRLDFGVTLFFILSGFLLARPFYLAAARGDRAPSTRHYLWKRALRILPLYWVVVVVALLADPKNADADAADWISHLTLTQLYRHDLLGSSLTQMWSLCTEVAFYLLLPPLALLAGRRRGRLDLTAAGFWMAVLAVLGIAWQSMVATIPGHEGHYAQWLPGLMPWFLVGMWFAAVSASLSVDPREHLLERLAHDVTGCWLLGWAVFAIACSPIAGPRLLLVPGHWEAGAKDVLYTLAGAFLTLPLMFGPEREGRVRRVLSGPVLFWLGEISYGIFAIHMFVLNQVFDRLDIDIFTGHFVLVLSVTLAVTVALASVSFYLFEKPILRLKNLRFFARMEPPRAPIPATPR